MSAAVKCTKCSAPLEDEPILRRDWQWCVGCGARIQAFAFPAIARGPEKVGTDLVFDAGDATCFYHESRSATVSCDGCGRFLCSLCDLEIGGEHLCTACVSSGKKKGKLKKLENRRMRYDAVALVLSLAPLLCWPFTIFTAPATLFFAIRYWKTEGSILGRRRYQSVLAMIIALAQVAGWIFLIVYLIWGNRK